MPFARQRVAKHVPAEAYRGTTGRPFLRNSGKRTYESFGDGVFRRVRPGAI
jgi:hypothetical protein